MSAISGLKKAHKFTNLDAVKLVRASKKAVKWDQKELDGLVTALTEKKVILRAQEFRCLDYDYHMVEDMHECEEVDVITFNLQNQDIETYATEIDTAAEIMTNSTSYMNTFDQVVVFPAKMQWYLSEHRKRCKESANRKPSKALIEEAKGISKLTARRR